MISSRRRFVLLDRDGTLIIDRHYLADPAGVELLPGTGAALRRLSGLGLGLVIVTNQSGVARGKFSLETVGRVHERLAALLRAEGIELDGIYVCPHGPDEGCACRKPRPGLAYQAADELGFDPAQSFVIGDKPADVELGRAIDAFSILVRTGHGSDGEAQLTAPADATCDTLEAAAAAIDWELRPR
jgi:D-glycero-D-manno-heptose 1,7-bisphosphate phosphatase